MKFPNDDATSHVIPNPVAMKGKVIKVVPSYFCAGVYKQSARYLKENWSGRNIDQ